MALLRLHLRESCDNRHVWLAKQSEAALQGLHQINADAAIKGTALKPEQGCRRQDRCNSAHVPDEQRSVEGSL